MAIQAFLVILVLLVTAAVIVSVGYSGNLWGAVPFGFVALFVVAKFLPKGVRAIQSLGQSIRLSDQGLTIRRGNSTASYNWDAIDVVVEKPILVWYPQGYAIDSYDYLLKFSDGRELRIHSGFQDQSELAEAIFEAVRPYLGDKRREELFGAEPKRAANFASKKDLGSFSTAVDSTRIARIIMWSLIGLLVGGFAVMAIFR